MARSRHPHFTVELHPLYASAHCQGWAPRLSYTIVTTLNLLALFVLNSWQSRNWPTCMRIRIVEVQVPERSADNDGRIRVNAWMRAFTCDRHILFHTRLVNTCTSFTFHLLLNARFFPCESRCSLSSACMCTSRMCSHAPFVTATQVLTIRENPPLASCTSLACCFC